MEIEDLNELNFSSFPVLENSNIKDLDVMVRSFFSNDINQSSMLNKISTELHSIKMDDAQRSKMLNLFDWLMEGRSQFNIALCSLLEHLMKRD